MSDTSPLNVKLPARLRERARKMAKERRTSTTALIVEALLEKVDSWEAKQREETDLRRRDDEERRQSRRRAVVLADRVSLAPAREDLAPGEARAVDEDAEYMDHPLYVEHARRIRGTEDATDRRIVAREAVEAIVKQYPLTGPPDFVIIRRLEKIIVRLDKEDAPTERVIEMPKAPPPPVERPSFLQRVVGWAQQDSMSDRERPSPVDDDGDE